MGIINVLDTATANLIAAGEVVERPSSAIKELLENCADAGADKVTVEIKNGGSTFIRVTDNGCGMSREDVPTAILRHATSKIRTKEDLSAIGTLGFRGEALAAIASVTRLSIMTKRKCDTSGTLFESDFGSEGVITDVGCPDGTTIIARNLFENVPARRKFLKRDATEAQAVIAAVEKFALSKPYISVTTISDGVMKLKTPGDGVLSNAVYATLGREFAEGMILCDYSYGGIDITGFICKPELCRSNRSMQNFFINERYVRSRTMCAALEEAFKSYCPSGKFPGAVLYLSIGNDLVDVNIHPAKLEVKFVNEKTIFDSVYYAVRNSLSRGTRGNSLLNKNAENGTGITFATMTRIFPADQLPKTEENEEIVIEEAVTLGEQTEQNKAPLPFTTVEEEEGRVIASTEAGFSDKSQSISDSTYNNEIKLEVDDIIPKKEPDIEVPLASRDADEHLDFIKNFNISIPSVKTDASKTKDDFINDKPSTNEQGSELPKEESISLKRPSAKPIAETISMLDAKLDNESSIADKKELERHIKRGVNIIGEAFNAYIIVDTGSTLYLVDKHAAHERILYESMKNAHDEKSSQLLLAPISVQLSSKEAEAVSEHGDYLEKTGFVFEEFGRNSYLLRGLPVGIEASDAKELFTFLADKLADGNGKAIGDIFDRALYTAACKAAVKAGQSTSELSNTVIIDKLFSDEGVLYCPHGRPVIIEFTKAKLDKMFGRT